MATDNDKFNKSDNSDETLESSSNDSPLYIVSEESVERDKIVKEMSEDEDKEDITEGKEIKGSPFMALLKILINPVNGWKSFRRKKWSPEYVARDCFYPLLAVAAALRYIMLFFFDGHSDVTTALTSAVVVFITFFFGYYVVTLLSSLLMPSGCSEIFKTDDGKKFVMMNISSLVLFLIIYELLPMLTAITVFLPLWTIYIVCRGMRFMHIPKEKENSATGMACVLILGIPALCGWLFDEIL